MALFFDLEKKRAQTTASSEHAFFIQLCIAIEG